MTVNRTNLGIIMDDFTFTRSKYPIDSKKIIEGSADKTPFKVVKKIINGEEIEVKVYENPKDNKEDEIFEINDEEV